MNRSSNTQKSLNNPKIAESTKVVIRQTIKKDTNKSKAKLATNENVKSKIFTMRSDVKTTLKEIKAEIIDDIVIYEGSFNSNLEKLQSYSKKCKYESN